MRRSPVEGLVAHFDDWVRALDPARRKSTITVSSFAAIAVLGIAGMAVAAFVPGPREFFQLRFWPAFGWFVLALAPGFPMGVLEARGKLSLRAFGVLSLIGAFFFQTFQWSMVAYTELPGSTVMAAFPILLVSFHGHLYQSSVRRPLPLIVSLAALGAGIALGLDADHAAIYAIAGPMAIGSHLLLGYYARLDYRARLEREALRAAVDAQILNERVADVARVTSILSELRGRSHDAGNALSGLLLNVPHFVSLLERLRVDPAQGQEAEEAVVLGKAIASRLDRLKTLLVESKDLAGQSEVRAVSVTPRTIVEAAVAEVRSLHPTVRFELDGDPNGIAIPFYGGEEAFHRTALNLLLNACEGDGQRGARHVRIEIGLESPEEFVVRVIDDGPGFKPAQLEQPFDRLETTKPHGSGLGVYTTSRVLAASGARLERRNRNDQSGARVTMRLRTRLDGAS